MAIATAAPVTHNRADGFLVLAVVAALHTVVLWGLLKVTLPLKIRTSTSHLELTHLTLGRPEGVVRRPPPALSLQPLGRQNVGNPPTFQPRPPTQPSAAATTEEDNAIHPPIDWAEELNRTARKVASDASAPQPRAFGAPHHAPAPPAKPPEFAWSRSRTHRLETGPDGAAVHLGDNCVIAFTPLPFPVCRLGKKEANGDLFQHMRDPPPSDDWKSQP
jgi:hypothetical protein